MSKKLEPEHRDMVARAVIGSQVTSHKWEPENEFWQWQMLIEFMADKIAIESSINFPGFDKAGTALEIMEMVHAKDINGLEAMVFEMVDYDTKPAFPADDICPIDLEIFL